MTLNISWVGPYPDSCYDEKTEVLTNNGWKFFKDLSFDDKLATLNKQLVIEYHYPQRLIGKDWDSDMYYFKSKKGAIDVFVTPDHSMFVRSEKSKHFKRDDLWKFETASEVYNKTRDFKRDAYWEKEGPEYIEVANRKIKTEHWLEFLGYYLSEGSTNAYESSSSSQYFSKKDQTYHYYKYRATNYILQIRQLKKSNQQKMFNAVKRVTSNSVNLREEDGRILVHDKDLVLYLKRFGNCYNKYIPREILNNCSSEQLKILFEALMLGDGADNRYREGSKGSSKYFTSSKRLRDDIQELLLKIGYSGSYKCKHKKGSKIKIYDRVYYVKEDHWAIGIRFKFNNYLKKSPKWNHKSSHKEGFSYYRGKVYCATVPNHTLFVRRNGCVLWCGNSGYANNSKMFIRALYEYRKQFDLNINAIPVSFENQKTDFGKEGDICSKLTNTPGFKEDVRIINTTPEFYEKLKGPSKNIAYTTFELDRIPDLWVRELNKMDAVFVTTTFCEEVFKKSGVQVPVYTVNPGVHPEDYLKHKKPVNNIGIPEDAFKFYSIFQWTARKRPEDLLRAYWAEFSPEENVYLILKAYKNDTSPKQQTLLKREIAFLKQNLVSQKGFPRIFLIPSLLTRQQIIDLHLLSDCFVLPHAGEGHGIPHFEAMAFGNPVITTGWSGNMDFTLPEYTHLLDYHFEGAHSLPWCPWNENNMYWARPDFKQLREKMRWVYENQKEAKERALKGQEFVLDKFKWSKCLNILVKRTKEILRSK